MRKQRKPIVPAILLLIAATTSGQNLPDIRDSLEPLELPDRSGPLMLVPWAAAIVIVAILIWFSIRSRFRQGSVESPEACAERRLVNIANTGPRAFYTELHSIFVEYLDNRVLIKASRCTTPELLDLLANAHLMSADWCLSVEAFLADCDRAKFSPAQSDRGPDAAVAECRALISRVATAPLLAMGTGRRKHELV
jgi:hypothetical protein